MEITKTRLRKTYAPLNVLVSLTCITNESSPIRQVYTAALGTFEPNRQISPCIILPKVTINAVDGSLETPYGNSNLDLNSMQWYVDGNPIEESPLKDKYKVLTVGSLRGALEIYYNVSPGQKFELYFEGKVVDTRTGEIIPIKTDSINISTVDKSEDDWNLSVEMGEHITYNPLDDELHQYDYLVAHGLSTYSEEEENSYINERSYKFNIKCLLYSGPSPFTGINDDRYKIGIYRKSGSSEIELLEYNDNELIEIIPSTVSISKEIDDNGNEVETATVTPTEIWLDLRLVSDCTYVIKAIGIKDNGDSVVIRERNVGVKRVYPTYRVETINHADISPKDIERFDRVQVSSKGTIIKNPENCIQIIWNTENTSGLVTTHNEGQTTLYRLDETGIGDGADDSQIDQYIESGYKDTYSIALDNDGNTLVDNDGNTIIFN